MKSFLFLLSLSLSLLSTSAFLASPPHSPAASPRLSSLSMALPNRNQDVSSVSSVSSLLQKGALSSLLSLSLLSPFNPLPSPANAFPFSAEVNQVSQVQIAAEETRSGLYKDYTVEKTSQTRDNAASTFKSKEETGENRNKYVAVLGVLLLGSAVIPMAQYYWYVKEE